MAFVAYHGYYPHSKYVRCPPKRFRLPFLHQYTELRSALPHVILTRCLWPFNSHDPETEKNTGYDFNSETHHFGDLCPPAIFEGVFLETLQVELFSPCAARTALSATLTPLSINSLHGLQGDRLESQKPKTKRASQRRANAERGDAERWRSTSGFKNQKKKKKKKTKPTQTPRGIERRETRSRERPRRSPRWP